MPSNPASNTTKNIQPMKERYQNVDENEIELLGEICVDVEYNNKKMKLSLLSTERNYRTPLLGVNWLKQLTITIKKIALDKETNQSETSHTKFRKVFKTNHTIINAEVLMQIKRGCYPKQLKARPIPYLLQDDLINELDRLIKS